MSTSEPDARQALILDLQTLRDWLRYAVSRFAEADVYCGHGTDNHWDEAVHLLLQTLFLPMDDNVHFLDARLTRDERERVLWRIERRVEQRVPVPYLTGEAWFMGLPFYVDERVLIPRSPLAEFLAQDGEPWLHDRPIHRILDLCTGSGCIGIAAAHQFPDAQVDLADVSSGALEVARQNIQRYGIGERVRAVYSDVFDDLAGRYDLIITNPPYVDAEDLASMPPEYRHEPALGLAAGDDGLSVIRRILREAHQYLTPGGVLVGEVGNSQAALEEAFPTVPFTWIEFEHGGHGVFLLEADDLAGLQSI